MTPRVKKELHQQFIMTSHPMKKMMLYNLLNMSKMSKWLNNNSHLMTLTPQVNKAKLKLNMPNH